MGASRITYLNATRDKAYTVRQSKFRFLTQMLRLLWLTLRLWFGYRGLLAKYRKGYAEITVPSFWQRVLKLDKVPSAANLASDPVSGRTAPSPSGAAKV